MSKWVRAQCENYVASKRADNSAYYLQVVEMIVGATHISEVRAALEEAPTARNKVLTALEEAPTARNEVLTALGVVAFSSEDIIAW